MKQIVFPVPFVVLPQCPKNAAGDRLHVLRIGLVELGAVECVRGADGQGVAQFRRCVLVPVQQRQHGIRPLAAVCLAEQVGGEPVADDVAVDPLLEKRRTNDKIRQGIVGFVTIGIFQCL